MRRAILLALVAAALCGCRGDIEDPIDDDRLEAWAWDCALAHELMCSGCYSDPECVVFEVRLEECRAEFLEASPACAEAMHDTDMCVFEARCEANTRCWREAEAEADACRD